MLIHLKSIFRAEEKNEIEKTPFLLHPERHGRHGKASDDQRCQVRQVRQVVYVRQVRQVGQVRQESHGRHPTVSGKTR